jgi:hypothetical protein
MKITKSQASQRDTFLDFTKGFACILMVFAHLTTGNKAINTPTTQFFWYLGFFAPVFFFATLGISLNYQLKKKKSSTIIITYLLLFIFSISEINRFNSTYILFPAINLFASLSVSALISIIFISSNNLFYSLIPFLLHFLFIYIFNLKPQFFLVGSLFSPIPWASFTLLGDYLNKNSIKRKIISLSSGFLLLYLVAQGYIIKNQSVNLIFITTSLFIFSVWLEYGPKIEQYLKSAKKPLIYFGQNSILFLILHSIVIYLLPQNI